MAMRRYTNRGQSETDTVQRNFYRRVQERRQCGRDKKQLAETFPSVMGLTSRRVRKRRGVVAMLLNLYGAASEHNAIAVMRRHD